MKNIIITIPLCLAFAFLSCATGQPTAQHSTVPEEPSRPKFDASYLAEQVIVRRTEYGVPHIQAENLRAAGYAMGFVQAEDYGKEVVEDLIRARGEWLRHNEPDAGDLDKAVDGEAANRRNYLRAVETYHRLKADTRDLLEGFAIGVNRYIELNPEEFEEWDTPEFTGYDVHAQGISSPSRTAIRRFLNALDRQKQDNHETGTASVQEDSDSQLFGAGDRTIWARLSSDAKEPHPDVGSNAWALAPSRTTSGNAILVRNPHLSWSAGYYEAHMEVPGKLNFYGDFRIGGPLGIIGGFNERLGWATTNNGPDLDEVYAFDIDPRRADHFLLDGASLPIQRETISVEFKNGEGTGRESREFLSTALGPVIHRGNGKIYVMRMAGDGEFRTGEQFLEMMKAQNLAEWKKAMQMRARTSSNLTYADADGNIFYVWNATIPNLPHEPGGDSLAVSVSETRQIWIDPVEWEKLPQLENPKGGYLRNENDPFHFTNLNEVLDKDDYPSHFPEPRLRLRSQHSLELIHNNRKFSLEDIVELKHSMRMLLADRVKDDLVAAVRSTGPTGEVERAIEHIEQWDNTVARGSRGGVLFKTWWDRYVSTADSSAKRVRSTPESAGFSATPEKLFAEVWSPEQPAETPHGLADPDRAVDAFEWAIGKSKELYGGWDLAWGDVHRARIGDKDVAVGGCTGLLGCFRVLWFVKHKHDDKKLEVRGGDGWVLAVEFGEVPRAYSILAYGQSIKKDSPHFRDQLEMFANNEMKRIAFTDEQIEEQLISTYHPGVQQEVHSR